MMGHRCGRNQPSLTMVWMPAVSVYMHAVGGLLRHTDGEWAGLGGLQRRRRRR